MLELVPAQTRIGFTLDATLHQVEGTAHLLEGALRFDEAAGSAEGRIAIDARSLETGNRLRDRSLHADVLESERYPEIVFAARSFTLARSGPQRGEVVLAGSLRIHGGEHPLEIPAQIERDGDAVRIAAAFRIPYVAWGLRDVSNLLLRVAQDVEVRVEATARLR